MTKKKPKSIKSIIDEMMKPCDCGACDDCLDRIAKEKEKPNMDIFIKHINHYNDKKDYGRHFIRLDAKRIMEIDWVNHRWEYFVHKVEKPLK